MCVCVYEISKSKITLIGFEIHDCDIEIYRGLLFVHKRCGRTPHGILTSCMAFVY